MPASLRRRLRPSLFAILTLCALPAGCADTAPQAVADRFASWRDAGHRKDVEAYTAFLRREGLHDTMPMPALLRTSRRWQTCLHDEFSVPPAALWNNMAPTLTANAAMAGVSPPYFGPSSARNARSAAG